MNPERIYTTILGPHLSEKAANAAESSNQFVFKVDITANKLEVRKAVESLFNVKVESVRIVLTKGKVKRNRYGFAKRSDAKKAYVRLAAGQEIDFSVAG